MATEILSIQSHVAYGYVGNRAATFPLQRLGYDVTAVNTVQFSNHTGYGEWTGQVFTADHVASLIDGVEARGGLDATAAIVSGYLGDASLGSVVLDAVERVKARNPMAIYACDPVMGDLGRGFFVRDGIPEFFKTKALTVADILIPNQFELAHLADRPVTSLETAMLAMADIRALGPSQVLLTSFEPDDASADEIAMLLDTTDGTWRVSTPRLPLNPAPNGAGDCTAALYTGKYLRLRDPAAALAETAAAIYAVFEATAARKSRELALIDAQKALVNAPQSFVVERVR
ncbi:MAG: pyridoxal kinase PdxY [Alphaproteobacteria bacterium]|nr:pyridoxal kinase PdxY [Alphaproteobacteria bacterium SS10]